MLIEVSHAVQMVDELLLFLELEIILQLDLNYNTVSKKIQKEDNMTQMKCFKGQRPH